MDDSAEIIRDLLQGNSPNSRAQGYPAKLRRRAAMHAAARRAGGEMWEPIAASLGLNRTTVCGWVAALGSERGELVPVVTVPEREVEPRPALELSCPVLVSPRGWRLEGLSLAAALAALERLG